MFRYAVVFDQNLSLWNVENVTDMLYMLFNTNLSTVNYDALLIGWDTQNLLPNIAFNGRGATYCL
jgi:hypothetical protein